MNNAKDEGNRKGKRRASAAAQEQQQEQEGSRSRPLSGRLKQRTLPPRATKLSPYFSGASSSSTFSDAPDQSQQTWRQKKPAARRRPVKCIKPSDCEGASDTPDTKTAIEATQAARKTSKPEGPDETLASAKILSDVIPPEFGCCAVVEEPLPPGFSLAQSICSYGYFFLAPNTWIPAPEGADEDDGIFVRPLELPSRSATTTTSDERNLPSSRSSSTPLTSSRFFRADSVAAADSVASGALSHQEEDGGGSSGDQDKRKEISSSIVAYVIVRQSRDKTNLCMEIRHSHQEQHEPLTAQQKQAAKAAIVRILRLNQDLQGWFDIHPTAAERGFGRTYRSPTLFEDMVKTITNCNIHFSRTIAMNELLCKHFGRGGIAFPSPQQLCGVSEKEMKDLTKVGYRANRILLLAKQFANGELCASWFEDPSVPTADVQARLMALYGFGKFATSNVLQLLGRYDASIEAWDTETVRLMKELGFQGDKGADFHEIARLRYEPFSPYQFLAYWFELWLNYEQRVGCTSPRWTCGMFSCAM